MDATNNIATDLFYKIRSRFTGLKLGESTGQITINPENARFFDFDYTEGDKNIGHVSISIAEPNSMKVYFSNGITEGMDGEQKDNWYDFLRELRMFAKRRLLAFDTRDIAKDNLDKRDYAFLSQHSMPQPDNDTILKPVGEAVMNESNLYGTKTQSFQKLMDTRLIIKHSKTLADEFEQKPGDRSRNISALFVENQDGERFKYPFIHLAGARAMQRHVANGGLPYDAIGESIIKMSEEIAQLKSFTNYCVRNDLMNSDTNSIVERSKAQLDGLRERIARLSKQAHYENYVAEFQAPEAVEVPDDVMEEYKEKFTVKNFKEDIANAFPIIYKLMKEEETVGYDDIVGMSEADDNKEEKIQAWWDKWSEYEAGNGNDMAKGYLEYALDSGIGTDFFNADEYMKVSKEMGMDSDDSDAETEMDHDEMMSKMPLTKQCMDEINAITGTDDMEKNGEMINDVVKHFENQNNSDPMASFETWVNNLGEQSPIVSAEGEEKADLIKKLNGLIDKHFPAGVDGTNAIQSLQGIIEDPELETAIKNAAKEDSEQCVRPMIKSWIEQNAPEIMNELDFGDMVEMSESEAEPAKCTHCDGKGTHDDGSECPECGGRGFVTQEASGYEGQSEPHKHTIDIEGDYDEDRGIDEKECSMMEKELAEKGIKAACEPNEMRQGSVFIHTSSDKQSVVDALEKAGYKAEAFEETFEDAGEKIAKMAQSMSKDEFMSHADELGLSAEEAEEHYEKMSGGAHVKEGGNAYDIAITDGQNEILDSNSEEEAIKRLQNLMTDGKSADDDYANDILKGMIDRLNKEGLDKVQHEISMSEGNEFAQKVRQMKAAGAKKGTKFKTSDGEEHTLEDVAKFIHSFYDTNTGTFPKGPEGVCTMVDKKFGEQAGSIARRMVERMAPAQEQGAEEIEELERIKNLIQY